MGKSTQVLPAGMPNGGKGEPPDTAAWHLGLHALASLVENSPELVAVVDAGGVLRYANPAHEGFYGYEADSIVGRGIAELVAPEDAPKVLALFHRTVGRPDATVRGSFRTSPQRGPQRVMEFAATNKVQDTTIRGFIVHSKDVTDRVEAVERLEDLLRETITAFATIVEFRDPYTAGHQRRVARLAAAIANRLGLHADEVDGIEVAASIHDIGKIAIPAEILARPGPLTEAERRLVECHAERGAAILERVPLPWPVAEMVAQHHERLDGSGYPEGLVGDDILLGARIIAVADAVEAIASHRPYRPGKGIDKALGIVLEGRGITYDADVVNACVELIRDEGLQIESDAPHVASSARRFA